MDPNELLNQLRELANAETPFKEDRWDQLIELCEKFKKLDNWLTNGGFGPKAWYNA